MAGYKTLGGGITQLSDSLQTKYPTSPNGAGQLDPSIWAYGPGWNSSAVTPVSWPAYQIGASSIDGLNCFQWGIGGAAAPSQSLLAVLIPHVLTQGVFGKTQFVQCTLLQRSGNAGVDQFNGGLTVCQSPALAQSIAAITVGLYGYDLIISSADGTTVLQRAGILADSGNANLQILGAGTFSTGDVVRLSADLSSPSQVVLTISRNGTVIATVTDNSASQIRTGIPGLMCGQVIGTGLAKSEWRNFSAGVGL